MEKTGNETENWDALLKVFHAIDMSASDSKGKYEKLKEMAKSKNLTPRQYEGILARCDYAISGEYGNTKTSENLGYDSVAPAVTKAQQNGKP